MKSKMAYNIYCDETCHLEHDNQKYMVLGGIICKKEQRNRVKIDIINFKKMNSLKKTSEIKWNKVSPSKFEFFKSLVDYFFETDSLRFRAIIINKEQLNHKKFNQTHDDWYYKMYYQLLQNLVEPKDANYIYLDIKDTKSANKIEGVKKYLNKKMIEYDYEPIKHIQSINSEESLILQLTDLFIGAIGYKNRGIYTEDNSSKTKTELMKYISMKSGYSLTKSTFLSEKKFNLFCIDLSVGGKND